MMNEILTNRWFYIICMWLTICINIYCIYVNVQSGKRIRKKERVVNEMIVRLDETTNSVRESYPEVFFLDELLKDKNDD